MKIKANIGIVTIWAVMMVMSSNAQQKIVSGIVTTFDSIAVVGAEITVNSTKQTVLSDTLGKFSVQTDEVDKLKVKAKGFFTQNVKLDEKVKIAVINLKLKPGEKNTEIAIGYVHISDRDKLHDVATLNNGDMDFSQYSDIYQLIKGRLAGVQVINDEIVIRGTNFSAAGNAALIVVDGIPTNGSILKSIPPSQVKSINVLKGSSTAAYGSRGGNGVVIIETKRGEDK